MYKSEGENLRVVGFLEEIRKGNDKIVLIGYGSQGLKWCSFILLLVRVYQLWNYNYDNDGRLEGLILPRHTSEPSEIIASSVRDERDKASHINCFVSQCM